MTRKQPANARRDGFWRALATPTVIWVAVFLAVPAYVLVATALGTVDPIFRLARPVWDPLHWTAHWAGLVLAQVTGGTWVVFVRSVVYVAIASAACLLIGYPLAYYTARIAGRHRTLLLAALIVPFFISYLMRMLAWINLLQTNGYINGVLHWIPFVPHEVNWLVGNPVTVVFGLVYGYVPYVILPLYGALGSIPQNLLEASNDLGATPRQTFLRVTLPLSRPAIVAALFIVALPMLGDYYTANLLSGASSTTMIGNVIDNAANSLGNGPEAAVYTLFMLLVLIVPVVMYARFQRKGLYS